MVAPVDKPEFTAEMLIAMKCNVVGKMLGIKSLSDSEICERLEELYLEGFAAGYQLAKGIKP